MDREFDLVLKTLKFIKLVSVLTNDRIVGLSALAALAVYLAFRTLDRYLYQLHLLQLRLQEAQDRQILLALHQQHRERLATRGIDTPSAQLLAELDAATSQQ